jgi:hypothetical protein
LFHQHDARASSRCYLFCHEVIALHGKNMVVGKRSDRDAGYAFIPSRRDSLPDQRLKGRFKLQLALDEPILASLV